MDDVVIRPARPHDAEALVSLAKEIGTEPEAWLISVDDWRDTGAERRLLRALRRHPDAQVFVAEGSSGIVGRLSVGRDPHPASAHVADVGLMVAAGHRRRGIGRRLLAQAVEWAASAGVRKLELHVFPYNEPALALYESFGFEREGYRRGHYVRNGRYVDAVLMALDLEAGAPTSRETQFPRS
jgi:RimJ/RimL family protein N-acetyltransferase